MWKQCLQEHPKALILDSKAPKILVNQGKNYHLTLRVQEVASSNLITPTIFSAICTKTKIIDYVSMIFVFYSSSLVPGTTYSGKDEMLWFFFTVAIVIV